MIEKQLSMLWSFARGDTPGLEFEQWFFTQHELEEPLGADLHWALASVNYSDRDGVWRLRKQLADKLEQYRQCECPTICNLDALPMGGDGQDERVFATLDRLADHGGDLWWLYLSACKACGQRWMIAQEERIFDEFFFKRMTESEANKVISDSIWPAEFLTYERVLKVGRTLSEPCRFIEALDPSLVWTAQDLRKERPEITIEEIAELVGVTPGHAGRLLSA